MTTAQIIALTRNQTWGTTTSQISDIQMLIYLNEIYKDIFSSILETDKKLTWNERQADTVAWQSEYTLPVLNTLTSAPWLKRLITMYIKYKSTDENYIKLWVRDFEWFEESLWDLRDDYEDKQSLVQNKQYPFPFIVRADEVSFFVNPEPIESVTNGLKIQWTYFPLDLTLLSESTDIKLQREYHNLISLWMEQYIYWFRQLDNKRNIAMNRYNISKQNMLSQQTNITEDARQDKLPENELSYFA